MQIIWEWIKELVVQFKPPEIGKSYIPEKIFKSCCILSPVQYFYGKTRKQMESVKILMIKFILDK